MAILKDSGERTEFPTGAVRDIQIGKGRCDLLPLSVIRKLYHNLKKNEVANTLWSIEKYQEQGTVEVLYELLKFNFLYPDIETMLLEVARHFEDGAVKYGDRNWEKGINTSRYIDSALRHYFKGLRGDTDEPHDKAFIWNILCCIWTCENFPELNDYLIKEEI